MVTTAAKAGDALAQMWLGIALITGDGLATDPKTGLYWVKRSAEAGYPAVELTLASLYMGAKGIRPDPKRARALLLKIYGAKGESAPVAAYFLGWMYMLGKGIPVDNGKAFKWMLIAANAHVSHAAEMVKKLTERLPRRTLAAACGVYLDPRFATDGAKEAMRLGAGELVALLGRVRQAYEVYVPDRMVGFVAGACLGGK